MHLIIPNTLYRISFLSSISRPCSSLQISLTTLSATRKHFHHIQGLASTPNSSPTEFVFFKRTCPCFCIARYCQDFYFYSHCFSSLHVLHKENMYMLGPFHSSPSTFFYHAKYPLTTAHYLLDLY
jgi:hypothetical protein